MAEFIPYVVHDKDELEQAALIHATVVVIENNEIIEELESKMKKKQKTRKIGKTSGIGAILLLIGGFLVPAGGIVAVATGEVLCMATSVMTGIDGWADIYKNYVLMQSRNQKMMLLRIRGKNAIDIKKILFEALSYLCRKEKIWHIIRYRPLIQKGS